MATQLRRPLSSFFLSTFHTFGFRCIQLVSALLSFAPINFHLASAVCEYELVGGEETHYAVTLIIISAFRVTFNYAKYFLCSFKRAQLFAGGGRSSGRCLKKIPCRDYSLAAFCLGRNLVARTHAPATPPSKTSYVYSSNPALFFLLFCFLFVSRAT